MSKPYEDYCARLKEIEKVREDELYSPYRRAFRLYTEGLAETHRYYGYKQLYMTIGDALAEPVCLAWKLFKNRKLIREVYAEAARMKAEKAEAAAHAQTISAGTVPNAPASTL